MSSHRSTGSGAESSGSRNGQQNLQQVATQANALVGSTAGGANRGGNSESAPLRTVYVTNTARDAFNKVQHKYAAQILDGPQETPLGQLAEAGPTETMEERGKLVMAYVRHIEGLIQALSQAPRQN
ncbi:hypothetical protein MCOR34_007853 [Pyricularia oryzae]|nr:hypothetical protein MCOR34_007853 [Pyricularia oryzae]